MLQPYSVLLMYPDYLTATYGEDTYWAWTLAASPQEALANVRQEAARPEEGEEVARPEDFGCLAVLAGHHALVLSVYDGL